MSPELFDPDEFNIMDSRPTKCSDCYAFGMVIYEVLSGQIPFSKCHDYAVVAKVLKGKRPVRPQGAEGRWFTDGIWSILECCWMPIPGYRPKIEDVLPRLEVLRSWTPPPAQIIADPTAGTPPTWDPESTEESVDECEVASPQPLQQLRLEGNTNENIICPSAYRPLGLPNDAPGKTLLRRRTRNYREAQSQYHVSLDGIQTGGAEGWEWKDRGLDRFTEKGSIVFSSSISEPFSSSESRSWPISSSMLMTGPRTRLSFESF